MKILLLKDKLRAVNSELYLRNIPREYTTGTGPPVLF